MTEISSMHAYGNFSVQLLSNQMFTFANIGPDLGNTVSFKNLINKMRSNK